MTIPKHIYQTCKDKQSLGDELIKNISHIKALNTGWEYHLLDDHDCRSFILKHYGVKYLELFDEIDPEYGAAKADFFRYLLIYQYGGVYLDIKSTTTVPLDTWLKDDDQFILSTWDNALNGQHPLAGVWHEFGVKDEFQQWFIIASEKHPFLDAVIQAVVQNLKTYNPFIDGVGRIATLKTTGPIIYSLTILNMLNDQVVYRVYKKGQLPLTYSIVSTKHGNHRKLIGNNYATSKKPLVRQHFLIYILYQTFHFLKRCINYFLKAYKNNNS